jgi:ferritin-like metal-binding protein YciE
MDVPKELFEHELRDIYDAEKKLERALETMAKKVPHETMSRGFSEHRKATQEQVKRLEQIFGLVGKKPRREPCRGISGLIEEFTRFVRDESPSEEILNVFAAGAALKVEHYEIVAYQSLLRLANRVGLSEAVSLLEESLAEEEETARRLNAIADEFAGLTTAAVAEPVLLPNAEVVEEVAVLTDSERALPEL